MDWDSIGTDSWCDLFVNLCENTDCGEIVELDFYEDEDEAEDFDE